jgi:hypothetical protein
VEGVPDGGVSVGAVEPGVVAVSPAVPPGVVAVSPVAPPVVSLGVLVVPVEVSLRVSSRLLHAASSAMAAAKGTSSLVFMCAPGKL